MIIGEYNLCEHLKNRLYTEGFTIISLANSDQPKVDGIIIDWVKKEHPDFSQQAAIADHYTRKVPTFLYDRYSTLTYKEYKWLSKFKVKFYEPLILGRRGFDYLPQWTRMLKMEDVKLPEDTTYTLGYTGQLSKDKIKSFEKYYKEYATLYPNEKVAYTVEVSKAKMDEYNNYNLHHENFKHDDVAYMVVIDSLKNYNAGFLDPHIFTAMEHGCCPLLPIEHKYFHAMFKGLIVENISELHFFFGGWRPLRDAAIEEIYNRIEKTYPEFTIDYAINTIKDSFR